MPFEPHGEQRWVKGRPLSRRRSLRRGIAKLWMILLLPCILITLCLVIEIANLWLARAELENALESAALAAVKEWGDANGGDTAAARIVGVDFAAANTVRGQFVDLDGNYLVTSSPNQNAQCITLLQPPPTPPNKGILIFGAITDTATPHTFDATQAPSCGDIDVLLDASENGNLAADDSWGVSFLVHPNTDPNTRITQIVIDLQASGGTGTFDFSGGPPTLAVPSGTRVADMSGNSQPNISGPVLTAGGVGPPFPTIAPLASPIVRDPGFTNPASQIAFLPTTGSPAVLTINFSADGMADDGFAPGDRFRFGAPVTNVGSGSTSNDGDGIGADGVQATIFYQVGMGPSQSITVTFADNTDRMNDCIDPAEVDALSGSLIVNPQMIADLPCPASSAPNNNGQSFARAVGSGMEDEFAVHAVGSVVVPGICQNIFGLLNLEFSVSARSTAMYDCGDKQPRLIRIDELICP
ncbi:MAG TPA: hypothetical protein DCY79_16425 [Planctomycetaceae bacterium]|nr:hypothetical protein [Planctomycetaceae bacterium]